AAFESSDVEEASFGEPAAFEPAEPVRSAAAVFEPMPVAEVEASIEIGAGPVEFDEPQLDVEPESEIELPAVIEREISPEPVVAARQPITASAFIPPPRASEPEAEPEPEPFVSPPIIAPPPAPLHMAAASIDKEMIPPHTAT